MLFSLLLCLMKCASAQPDIKHVVLLLMENRPVDHFYGFSQNEIPGIDGLNGTEFNYANARNQSGKKVYVANGKANYVCKTASRMSYSIFNSDIFGPGNWDGKHAPYPKQVNSGYLEENKGSDEIMYQFSPAMVPIKTVLAQEFGLFDHWYSSFPGPSTPNHLFLQTGTSAGCTNTGATYHCKKGALFPQKTIYESLLEVNKTWAVYYNDSAWHDFIKFFHTPAGAKGTRPYSEFFDKAAKGTLPNFSFIFPRQGKNRTTGQGSNDDHPCHDVALGERLQKDIYEALRAGKGWNNTVLLITYDDAGGWYDHAKVPVYVPQPDDEKSCPDNTDFTWTGVRVPTLLISPWVSKGRLISGPSGDAGSDTRPAADSIYEHSSLPATLKHLFDLPDFLTKRDAWAAPFHGELTELMPRTDTPYHLPEPPPPTSGQLTTHGCIPTHKLTRRQKRRIKQWAEIHGEEAPDFETLSQDVVESAQDLGEKYIEEKFHAFLQCTIEENCHTNN